MKQESVNTFSEGLNYDLSPLTTPKTILTDNVNGTFITFNGDELALQNDAGNTTIKYNNGTLAAPDWKNVALSPGFSPLGIKEYGGILYIVSGKDFDRNVKELVLENDYTINDIILSNGYYYKCLQDHKLSTLDTLALSTYWENLGPVGNKETIKEIYNEVEFGSYPAPEESSYNKFISKTLNITKDTLYQPFLVNSNIFKAGRYITFQDVSGLDDNVDSKINQNQLYQVKLYLQLENGMLDLTEDIWKKFIAYNPTGNHWLLDPTFKYYCTSQFKGYLILQVELQEPDFTVGAPELIPSTDSSVTIFNIETNGIIRFYNALTGAAEMPTIEDSRYTFESKNVTINYEIYPNTPYDFESYPEVFRSKYTVKGSFDLHKPEYKITFNSLSSVCDNGTKIVNVLEVVNELGAVTTGWQTSPNDQDSTSWILIKEGYTYQNVELHIPIGTYIINEDGTAVVTITDPDFNDEDKLLFIKQGQQTLVSYNSPECNNLPISFDFSMPLSMTSPSLVSDGTLFVYQDSDVLPLSYSSSDFGKNFKVYAQVGRSIIIQLTDGSFGFNLIQIPAASLQDNVTHHIGLALPFEGLTWNSGFTKYVTFRTMPIPIKYQAMLDYIAGNSTVSQASSYASVQSWRVSNANHFSLVTDGEWCYLELELEWTDTTSDFPTPRTRVVPYYVDIAPTTPSPDLVPADAENLTNISKYTKFTFGSDSLFMHKTATLYLYPSTSTRTTSSRLYGGRTYTTR